MRTAEWLRRAERELRASAAGFDRGELRRLFDRDAARAYGVVTRDHAREAEPENAFWRFLYRARILMLGLASKLSRPRRIVFVACIVLAVWGTTGLDLEHGPGLRLALLPLAAVAGLVFLLVLELADRVLVRDELEVARELQSELLPHTAPEVTGFDFAFSYRTANTIGGDYYDFLPLADGRLAVVIGDASGHGIAAGLVMAIASSALKLGFDLAPDPVTAARLVNRALVRTGGRRAFMTLFCGVLEPVSGALSFVCAGHPYPMLRRAAGDIVELGSGGLPLGIRAELEPAVGEAVIAPGDTLLLYTDGIFESVDAAGEAFGFGRLRAALAPGGSSQEVHDRVLGLLDGFRGAEPLYDDCSVVVVRRAQ
ncbi:MAG: PP2C family protein-serine/threonine phosphatase [Thermoanaerobaculales bacterium]|nr:PP2C family protein-serine/threonine phosphatase [Thermoanaerobaculales bacterium]